VLDGRNVMNFDTGIGAWEMLIVASSCGALAAVLAKLRRPATIVLVMMNVGLAGTTAAAVFTARSLSANAPPTSRDVRPSLFRFSATENVLVVLLDGLQANVAAEVFRSTPPLAEAFEGFRFYKDTVGVAPTTFLSVPAIHAGSVSRLHDVLPAHFADGIQHRSFVTRFADAGYETTLINPIEGICPDKVAACTSAARILRSSEDQFRIETLRLLDLSLLRVSPVWLKRRIYADGRWLFAGSGIASSTIDPLEVRNFSGIEIQEGIRLFQEMANRLTLNDGTPTFKFVHSFTTHTPYVLDDGCEPTEISLEHVTSQARCALLAVASMLNQLKQANVYDNTVILVLADHGINPATFGQDTPGSREEWIHLAGAANPLFLLKRLGEKGPLRETAGAVYLLDVGATLCAASGACTTPLGIAAGQAAPDRPRFFMGYAWKDEYWKLYELPRPKMTPYEVRGPVWQFESWSLVVE
jgi:sulfatase-like protein